VSDWTISILRETLRISRDSDASPGLLLGFLTSAEGLRPGLRAGVLPSPGIRMIGGALLPAALLTDQAAGAVKR